ncbi:MAG: rod shape-determining protein MreC [Butyricicoccus sp.]|nr:rod shape-determining protein MreC [Butyricicoccus sp.]
MSPMRNGFTPRLAAGLMIAALLCLGAAVYSGATGGSALRTRVLGMVLTPVQQGVSWVSGKIDSVIGYFNDYEALEAENELLHHRVAELEQQLRDSAVALEENERLRELVGIAQRSRDFEYDIAEVISHNPGEWSSVLSIDKGDNAGIEEGDLIITAEGMVGYVSAVSMNYSEVTTVLDPEMQAGALLTRTRETAIAEGDYSLLGEGKLRLSYLSKDTDIVIGDTVETSGRGGVFPKGIMIGTVESILVEEDGMSNYAVLRPFVDVETITHVFIIKDFAITE